MSKKINCEEDEKIEFAPKITPIVFRHFEIFIELKKFTISSFKWMKIPYYEYKFKLKQIVK